MSAQTRGLSDNPFAGAKDSASDLSDRFGSIEDLTPDTIRSVQRLVAGRFLDVPITAELLDMLGIRERYYPIEETP